MKRLLGAVLAALTLAFVSQAHAADPVTLRVANYGGAFTDAQQRFVASLFTQRTGIKIEWIDGNPPDHLAKMLASKGRAAPFDLVYLEEATQQQAIDAGLVEKIDPKVVTNLQFLYPEAVNKDGYGPALIFWSVGIEYNSKIFAEQGIPPITSWADLWNPKLAGHLALPDITQSVSSDVIVAAARLTGGNEKDTSKAFDKLAELKPYYFYTSSSDLKTKFVSGDVWVAVWNAGRSWDLIDSGFPAKFVYPKEGGFGHLNTIDVVKGSTHPKEAMMFINQVLDPLSQLGQTNLVPNGPTNKLLVPILAAYPDLAKKVVASPEDLKQLYIPDTKVVIASFPKWVDQWNRKVKK